MPGPWVENTTIIHAADATRWDTVVLTPTATKTANYTAAAADLALFDATSGNLVATLPTAPADGTIVEVKKVDSSSNTVTITCGGSDTFTVGGGMTLVLAVAGHAVIVRYTAALSKWTAVSNDVPLASIDSRYGAAAAVTTNTYNIANEVSRATAAEALLTPLASVTELEYAETFPGMLASATAASSAANRGYWMRVTGTVKSAVSILVGYGTVSGNISVGVYANNGSKGRAAAPSGTAKYAGASLAMTTYGTTGGLGTIPITATDVNDGDWLFVSLDNTTASLSRPNGNAVAAIHQGRMYVVNSQFPAPTTVPGGGFTSTPFFWIAASV
jgi:Cu/Ag efflux protein CusF